MIWHGQILLPILNVSHQFVVDVFLITPIHLFALPTQMGSNFTVQWLTIVKISKFWGCKLFDVSLDSHLDYFNVPSIFIFRRVMIFHGIHKNELQLCIVDNSASPVWKYFAAFRSDTPRECTSLLSEFLPEWNKKIRAIKIDEKTSRSLMNFYLLVIKFRFEKKNLFFEYFSLFHVPIPEIFDFDCLSR